MGCGKENPKLKAERFRIINERYTERGIGHRA